MASTMNEARLMPVSEDDTISPGSFYFACLNTQKKLDPASYWIVLRAPREWLPEGFFDTRPVQARVFPFWIIGKDQRVWLPRTSLFELHRSQKEIFIERASKLEFTNFLILIEAFQNADAALTHFKRRIVDATHQYNERRERVERNLSGNDPASSSSSLFVESHDSHNIPELSRRVDPEPPLEPLQNDDNSLNDSRGQRKRQRREESLQNDALGSRARKFRTPDRRSVQPNASSESSIPTSQSQPQSQPETQSRIKKERIDSNNFLPKGVNMEKSRVRLYVGRGNKEYIVDGTAIECTSPILQSLISTDDEGGRFIMHPKLCEIDVADFVAVLEFIHKGDYEPALIDNPDGRSGGPMGLEGKRTAEQYSEALVQAAKYYLLAQKLQVTGFTDLITRKVISAQYKQYSNLALIEFARIMFTRPVYQNQRPPGSTDTGFHFEKLDQWVVAQLADNFMEIVRSDVEHGKYLEMIEATVERRIHAVILQQASNDYVRRGGLLEVIVDDD